MVRDLFRAPWLLDPRTFGGDDSGGGGGGDSGGGGGSSDSGSSSSTSQPTSQAAEKQTIGQVSSTGQYAGDGFEWVDSGSGYLTRTYTGTGKDNNLGTDVITGGTSDKSTKETIAAISLNQTNKPETVFGETKASATDGSVLDLFRAPEDQVGSSSYAAQVGAKTTTPSQTFDEAFASNRAAGKKTFTWNGNEYTTDLAPEPVAEPAPEPEPKFFDAFGNEYKSQEAATEADNLAAQQSATANKIIEEQAAAGPAFDYTGVSVGELGRGAAPGTEAPGTFTYEPGVDPVKEALVNLKNTAPETLSTSERLIANQYEAEREAAAEPLTGEELLMSMPVSPVEDTRLAEADTGVTTDDRSVLERVYENIFGSGEADTTGEKAGLVFKAGTEDLLPGLAAQGAEQVVGAGIETAQDLGLAGETYLNPLYKLQAAGLGDLSGLDRIAQENYINRTGDYTANQITEPIRLVAPRQESALEQSLQNYADRQFRELSESISAMPQDVQDALSAQAVTVPQKFGYGTGQVDPAFASALGEDPNAYAYGQTSIDPTALGYQTLLNAPSALATVGTSVVNPYAGFTLGGTMAGGEGQRTANQSIDEAFASGTLQGTEQFQDALNNVNQAPTTAGLSDAQKEALAVTQLKNEVSQGLIPLNVLSGAVSAATPGLLSRGPQAVLTVPALEGVEEGFLETTATEEALRRQAGVDDQASLSEKLSEAAVGAVTAGPAGISSLVSPSVTQPVADQTLQPGQFGGPTTRGGPRGPQAPTQPGGTLPGAPQVMTVAPNQFVPSGPREGQPALSSVETTYQALEQEPDLLRLTGPRPSQPTSMDVMAAKEIIDNVKAEQGTVPVEVMANLQQATGLSMQELSDLATDSVISMGNVSFDPAVGTEAPIAPDLMDQPTGIGGGSNISVEPLPSGDTLLRNNDTGRTTVVNQGQDLAEAIQVFDEVSTPFTAPEVDTTPPSLPPFVMDAGFTAPIVPGGIEQIQLPSAPIQLPSVDVRSGIPSIDVGVPALSDAGSRDLGGLEGEILAGEIDAAQTMAEEEPTIIEGEIVPEAEPVTEIEVEDTPARIGPPPQEPPARVVSEPEPEVGPTPITEIGPPDIDEEPPAEEPPAEEPGGGEPGTTVEVDQPSGEFVSPDISIGVDGEENYECPEGYQLVAGPDGPTCQKSVETYRMRAGRGLTPYTGLVIPEGYKGPGQKRKTVTTTESTPAIRAS